MKYLICLTMFLVGCDYVVPAGSHVIAEKICEHHGGYEYFVRSDYVATEDNPKLYKVKCKDGTIISESPHNKGTQ